MASLSKRKDGMRFIQFQDGLKRHTIYLPKRTTEKDARAFLLRVERLIVSKTTGQPVTPETQEWIASLPEKMHAKLAKVDLVEPRSLKVPRLSEFLNAYVESRSDVEKSTADKYGNTRRNLLGYFTDDPFINQITRADAESFARYLMGSVARTTAGKRIKIARMMFNWAINLEWLIRNPFEGIKAPSQVNRTRDYFVTREETDKAITAAPDAQWRLIIALARYGGLRTPSETLRLTWDDVLWDQQKIVIHAKKKAKDEHGGVRVIPMFPELKPFLEACWDRADDGSKYVITRYRDTTQNLRTTLGKILKRAGLEPWGKPFQNMRASRETELVERFPLHVAAYWIGNSMATAHRHYLQVTGQHFADAVETAADTAEGTEAHAG